ncbi:MAG: nucleotidyltransferase family protein [Acidobacteriota bacterium]|nr:nucleotidyltransferase family protein [Acidobacteriota bacterium]
MTQVKSSPEVGLLAAILGGAWRREPPSLHISEEEVDSVLQLLIQSGCGPLGWWRLRRSDLKNSSVVAKLRQAYLFSTAKTVFHENSIEQVFSALRSAGVEPILVKGWAAARLYPDQALRPYSDIDLCVQSKQYEIAKSVLDSIDFKEEFIDLHNGFSHLDYKSAAELYAHSKLVKLEGVDVRILSPEDQLRVLCFHFLAHGGSRAGWLCDIALAVENRPPDFDWQRSLGNNRRWAEWVACTIGLAHQLLGARTEDTPIAERSKNLPGWFVRAILKQWGTNSMEKRYRTPMSTITRHPIRVMKGLRYHWPNPVEATVRLRMPLNECPRLPMQVSNCLIRTALFLVRVPNRWRV